MYIGEKKIIKKVDNEDGSVTISFKSDPEAKMSSKLFSMVSSEKLGRGSITDAVNHLLATKFLSELASYDLKFYMVNGISTAMQTLVHNLREDLTREAFNCAGSDDISLKLLVEGQKEEVKE